jgi:hypothetical protein
VTPATRIVLAEPVRWEEVHQPFNTSLILACQEAFPDAGITFLAEASHLGSVRQALAPDEQGQVEFEPLEIPPAGASRMQRWRSAWSMAAGLVRRAEERRAEVLVLLSVSTELVWAFNALGRLRPLPRTVAVLHAGLAEVVRRPRYNLIERMASLRSAILASPPRIGFVVLERSILAFLTALDARLAGRMRLLPHPLPPDLLDNTPFRALRPGEPIRIGLLGLCTPQKGLFRFLRLAEHARMAGAGRLEFEIVGRLHQDAVERARPYLQYLSRRPAEQRLPRHEFTDAVRRLHFGAFLFEGDHYELTASGVLLDAIATCLPLVTDHPGLVSHLEAEAGAIGVTSPAPFEHGDLVRRLLAVTPEAYAGYSRNVLRLRTGRDPSALVPTLRELAGADPGAAGRPVEAQSA